MFVAGRVLISLPGCCLTVVLVAVVGLVVAAAAGKWRVVIFYLATWFRRRLDRAVCMLKQSQKGRFQRILLVFLFVFWLLGEKKVNENVSKNELFVCLSTPTLSVTLSRKVKEAHFKVEEASDIP